MPTPANSPVRKRFDYDSLDTEDAVFIQQQTGAIQSLMKRSAQDIVEIGQRLTEVKKRLGHGRFGTWLGAEFEWSEPTAQRFMRVAQRFKSVNLTDLSIAPSALYLLAAPSTSQTAREETISRAQAGESISYTAAKNLKQQYSPPKKEPDPASQVSLTQSDDLQDQGVLSPPTLTQTDTNPVQTDTSPRQSVASQSTQIKGLQASGVKYTPPNPPFASPSTPPASTPPATPISSADPASRLDEMRTLVLGPPAQATSASTSPPLRQRVTEPVRPRLEILAIRPKEADPKILEDDELEPVISADRGTPRFVQPGTWWQFGEEHLLYCGDPSSLRFRERLPEKVSLSLAFPPSRDAWPQRPEVTTGSSFAWFTQYPNLEVETLCKGVEQFLLLATENEEPIVVSFMPDPAILLLAQELDCRWFCAEPDPLKCEAAITAWKGKGFSAEKVSGLRF